MSAKTLVCHHKGALKTHGRGQTIWDTFAHTFGMYARFVHFGLEGCFFPGVWLACLDIELCLVFCSYGMVVDAASLYDDTLLWRAYAHGLPHDDNLLSFDGCCFCCVRCSLHVEEEFCLDRNSGLPH
jgi:hypothetical protein